MTTHSGDSGTPRPGPVIAFLYDLRVGGAETSLLAELREVRALGLDVSVAYIGTDETLRPAFERAGIPVQSVRGSSGFSTLRKMVGFLREQRPALVHTSLFWPDVVVRPVARLLGIPVLTSLTNEYYGPEHRENSKYGSLGVLAAHLADVVSSRFATRFHAISHRVAEVMGRRLLVPPRRITVIYRGRDLSHLGRRTPERRAATRASLGLGDESVFLCVGRQDHQKSHDTAVRAFAGLDDPDAVLLLAGRPGNNTAAIDAAIADAPASSRIVLLGERPDVADLLCAADFYVMPSRWEGLSGALIEAMALEIPLLVSDLAVFQEVTDTMAWFFTPGDIDACRGVLARALDQPYPADFIASSRTRAEETFEIGAVAAQLRDLYLEMMGARGETK